MVGECSGDRAEGGDSFSAGCEGRPVASLRLLHCTVECLINCCMLACLNESIHSNIHWALGTARLRSFDRTLYCVVLHCIVLCLCTAAKRARQRHCAAQRPKAEIFCSRDRAAKRAAWRTAGYCPLLPRRDLPLQQNSAETTIFVQCLLVDQSSTLSPLFHCYSKYNQLQLHRAKPAELFIISLLSHSYIYTLISFQLFHIY